MSRIRRIASFSSQPPFGSSVTRASREALVQRRDRLDLLLAAQHAALQLEVVEAVALRAPPRPGARPPRASCAFSWRRRNQSSSASRLARRTAGRSCVAVADVEQVAEHLDRVALLAFAEQRGDRHAEVLAEQVEQRRLDRGDGVDGGAQVEGLQAAAARVAVGEASAAPPAAARWCAPMRLADDELRARPRASGGSSRRPAPRRRRCGRRCR